MPFGSIFDKCGLLCTAPMTQFSCLLATTQNFVADFITQRDGWSKGWWDAAKMKYRCNPRCRRNSILTLRKTFDKLSKTEFSKISGIAPRCGCGMLRGCEWRKAKKLALGRRGRQRIPAKWRNGCFITDRPENIPIATPNGKKVFLKVFIKRNRSLLLKLVFL